MKSAGWKRLREETRACRASGFHPPPRSVLRPALPGRALSQHLWTPGRSQTGESVIRIRFARATCRVCPARQACTSSPEAPRQLTVKPQASHEALQAARQRQETPEFKAQYALRAGVESTLSQAVRRFALRQSRDMGLARTHIQQVLTAAASGAGGPMSAVVAWSSRVNSGCGLGAVPTTPCAPVFRLHVYFVGARPARRRRARSPAPISNPDRHRSNVLGSGTGSAGPPVTILPLNARVTSGKAPKKSSLWLKECSTMRSSKRPSTDVSRATDSPANALPP
ncbi:MAG: hypothetical protein FJZ47_13545 [Candidatus Tectomicrobia bacterium]|uniref:Transposase DDE domain-containing protein n=1 Tax=Tectimicrobiota bacterium TaxID=2528274 RepID=A0A937W253_UNCTE|nr:hypothetical protein [Candidatus Tectomicrobia bacterium]